MRPRTATEIVDADDLLPSGEVRRLLGNVTSMTIWRWTTDPSVGFPPPDKVIRKRKYWYRRTITDFQSRITSRETRRDIAERAEARRATR
jgi:hypothetical protein